MHFHKIIYLSILTYVILETGKFYVIKEIDTSNMTTEQAFDAIEEISVQATIDSPYVVSQKCFSLLVFQNWFNISRTSLRAHSFSVIVKVFTIFIGYLLRFVHRRKLNQHRNGVLQARRPVQLYIEVERVSQRERGLEVLYSNLTWDLCTAF